MKPRIAFAALALVFSAAAVALSETAMEKMMAGMKNCEVCKSMADKPELMEHSSWESHKIDNGMLCVMTVPKDHLDEFKTVHTEMMQAIDKVKAEAAAGKPVQLCEFCHAMGDLEKAGAKHQEISTETGAISLMTSGDPAVVQQIHAAADKAIEMQKEMKASMAAVH